MIAEVGFEWPTRKYSRIGRVRGSALPILLIFSLVALPPPRSASGRAPSPLPPRRSATAEGVLVQIPTEAQKKQTPDWVSVFLVAEVGFEPHDLRVMSPTSYQAALLRDMIVT